MLKIKNLEYSKIKISSTENSNVSTIELQGLANDKEFHISFDMPKTWATIIADDLSDIVKMGGPMTLVEPDNAN